MLIELDCLVIFLLWVRKQRAVYILPCRDLNDCLSADTFVDVERYRIDFERFRLAFACPLEPGLVVTKRFCESPCLSLAEGFARGFRDQFGQFIRCARCIEPKLRRTARAIETRPWVRWERGLPRRSWRADCSCVCQRTGNRLWVPRPAPPREPCRFFYAPYLRIPDYTFIV